MTSPDYAQLTADARTALARADAEARRLGHSEVAAAHLLIGLRLAVSDPAAAALRESGMDRLQRARDGLARLSLSRGSGATRGMAAELRHILEAVTSAHVQVSASTLCIALLADENTATELLADLGIDAEAVVRRLHREDETVAGVAPLALSLDERVHQAHERAELLAASVGREADDGDIAVALVEDCNSALARALLRLGITRELLEEALADTRPRSDGPA